MNTNIIRPLAGIGIAIVIGMGAIFFGPNIVGGGGGGPTGASLNANLWVVPSGQSGSCIRQATPLTVSASPLSTKCSSMNVACAAAAAGDTIRVQNGSYPSQTLATTCGGTSGSRITIDAQNGAQDCGGQMIDVVSVTSYTHNDCPVSINGDLTVSAHDLNVNNMSIDSSLDFPPSTSASQARVTATNIHSKIFGLTGDTITIKGGEAGGFYVCNQPVNVDTPQPQDAGHVGFAPGGTVNNITIDGYIIHDLYDISGGQILCGSTFTNPPHADCLQIAQGTNITVKNSQFWNCATSDIQSNADWTPYGSISYINNFFGHLHDAGGNAAEIGTTTGVQADDCTGTNVVAYNTFAATALEQVCGTTGTFVIEGNIFMSGIDVSGLVGAGASNTTEYNVFQSGAPGSPIGTNPKTCTTLFAGSNAELDGLHLTAGDSCATAAGKPSTTTVTTDIDGEVRGNPPEAGADEIVGGVVQAGCPTGTPTWNGGFDGQNLSQYSQKLTPFPEPGNRITFSTTIHECNAAAHWTIRDGDVYTATDSSSVERNQMRGIVRPPLNPLFTNNEDIYIRVDAYIDPAMSTVATFSNPWRALWALPSSQNGGCSSYHLGMYRSNGTSASGSGTESWVFSGDRGCTLGSDQEYWSRATTRGEWWDFIWHVKISTSQTVGFVQMWVDFPADGFGNFVRQTFRDGSQTMFMRSLQSTTDTNNMRLGIYRNGLFTTTDSLYYDNVRYGPSLASVGG